MGNWSNSIRAGLLVHVAAHTFIKLRYQIVYPIELKLIGDGEDVVYTFSNNEILFVQCRKQIEDRFRFTSNHRMENLRILENFKNDDSFETFDDKKKYIDL